MNGRFVIGVAAQKQRGEAIKRVLVLGVGLQHGTEGGFGIDEVAGHQLAVAKAGARPRVGRFGKDDLAQVRGRFLELAFAQQAARQPVGALDAAGADRAKACRVPLRAGGGRVCRHRFPSTGITAGGCSFLQPGVLRIRHVRRPFPEP